MTWGLMLAAAKRLEAYMGLVRAGKWRDGKGLPTVLAGQRLGPIGFGSIGQRVGEVGRAFGMELLNGAYRELAACKAAMPSAAARAAEIVVSVGIRWATAARRIACSSNHGSWP